MTTEHILSKYKWNVDQYRSHAGPINKSQLTQKFKILKRKIIE